MLVSRNYWQARQSPEEGWLSQLQLVAKVPQQVQMHQFVILHIRGPYIGAWQREPNRHQDESCKMSVASCSCNMCAAYNMRDYGIMAVFKH